MAGAGGWWLERRSERCDIKIAASGRFKDDQIDQVRCYLGAQARHDLAGLRAVAMQHRGLQVTSADLAYTQDVRAGTPRAHIMQNPIDAADALVVVTYATGRSRRIDLQETDPQVAASWRLLLGSVRTAQ